MKQKLKPLIAGLSLFALATINSLFSTSMAQTNAKTDTAYAGYFIHEHRINSDLSVTIFTEPQPFEHSKQSAWLFAPEDIEKLSGKAVSDYLYKLAPAAPDVNIRDGEHCELNLTVEQVRQKILDSMDANFKAFAPSPYSAHKIVLINPKTGKVTRELNVEKMARPPSHPGAMPAR